MHYLRTYVFMYTHTYVRTLCYVLKGILIDHPLHDLRCSGHLSYIITLCHVKQEYISTHMYKHTYVCRCNYKSRKLTCEDHTYDCNKVIKWLPKAYSWMITETLL